MYPTICFESSGTLHNQKNPERADQSWRYETSWSQNTLKGYTKVIKQCGTGVNKIEIKPRALVKEQQQRNNKLPPISGQVNFNKIDRLI